MAAGSDDEAQVNAKGPNVGPSLTAHPEDAQVPIGVVLDELAFVDCPDPELPLDSRDEGGALEECARKGLNGTGEL